MHELYTEKSRNILELVNRFTGFEYDTDYGGRLKAKDVKITGKIFPNIEDAENFVTDRSYYGESAYLAAHTVKKLSKGYLNAFESFYSKYNEYVNFKNNLTIAYGRNATKVTCPRCGSSISLNYGGRFKSCPVCGSEKIISDSNWKTLETKCRMYEKAAANLTKEAEKNDVTFVCGMEWHC